MDRKFFKRYMPDPKTIQESRYFRWVGGILYASNLWHLNRNSVSRAMAVGLFWSMVPMPLQSVPAVLMAVWLRANVGITVAATFVSNMFTIPPLLYASYRLGMWVLGRDSSVGKFRWSISAVLNEARHSWWPVLVGSLLIGLISGLVGYWIVQLGWKWKVARSHHLRKERRMAYRALRRARSEIAISKP